MPHAPAEGLFVRNAIVAFTNDFDFALIDEVREHLEVLSKPAREQLGAHLLGLLPQSIRGHHSHLLCATG